ncbi:DUF7286 family protein [Salinirubrum litoreum]|uniref:Peptidoglycan binding domain-containing protein n=1 Tax=Salinirubrum litoreum TaxID=1126234 RepID=A0ABD5RAR0_9EURY|nr:hypothetical protein [Salinirubrum litoreum]
MRLADDRRGRVPFALVGVLLLLGSTTFAVTLSTQQTPAAPDEDVQTAMERAEASAGGAVREATDAAARDAARNPVLDPADTPAGRVLNDSTAFRDALRLRIYHAVRDRFTAVESRSGDVVASPSLPPTPNASALRRAKGRVQIAGVQNGTALRVTVENVSITAREQSRGSSTSGAGIGADESTDRPEQTDTSGPIVGEEDETITLTVETPALALHERTERFEERLNTGALEGSGLGRRLTAELYVITWARGYAQYGGLPIQNVLGNHHVEVATNGGIVREQRAVFGRADPDAKAGTTRLALHAGHEDLAVLTGGSKVPSARLALKERRKIHDGGKSLPGYDRAAGTPRATDSISVGVNRTADVALVGLTTESNEQRDTVATTTDAENRSLDTVLADAYEPRVRLVTATREIEDGDEPAPDAPGSDWDLVGSDTERSTSVRQTARAPDPTVPDGSHRLGTFDRVVVERHHVTREWRRGNETQTTRASWTDRTAVGVAVVGDHLPAEVPDQRVNPIHETGGALDGPNLRGVPAAASDALVDSQGGPDRVAERVVTGELDSRQTRVAGDRPPELARWVRADLVRLRNRVANVSVTVRRGKVATARANPPARLAERIRDRRTDLLSVPPRRYDGIADVALVAARAAYLDRVVARLEARAERTETTNGKVGEALANTGAPARDSLGEFLRSSRTRTTPERQQLAEGPGTPVTVVPDGSPAVLTVVGVTREHVPEVAPGHTYEPMAARTTNVFTVPSGEIADGVISSVAGKQGHVSVGTAGKRLQQANGTLRHADDPEFRVHRNSLRRTLSERISQAETRAREVLGQETDLSASARRRAVSRGVARWNTTGERAVALGDGSLATAVAAAAVDAGATEGPDAPSSQAVESRLEVALSAPEFQRAVAVPVGDVKPIDRYAEQVARELVKEGMKRGVSNATELARERWTDDVLGSVPAGLPVAPVPGYWYATINVWDVRVRGQYARFTVRARTGGPTDPDAAVAYSRDGEAVRFDTDEDGTRERLGWNDPVDFEQRTAVVIAVPPNGNGVGDVDGNADERSPGWPTPGCRAQNCLAEGNASRSRFDGRGLAESALGGRGEQLF